MTVAATLRFSQEDIASFCRRNKIKELALFGSVLRDDVRPDSDVDVLVDFEPNAGHSLFDFVRMQEELGRLFGRKIDLVEKSGLHNPFRRYEILRTRQVIFAA
nr:nucleotidyltransferase family protein [Nitrospirota bacterium]